MRSIRYTQEFLLQFEGPRTEKLGALLNAMGLETASDRPRYPLVRDDSGPYPATIPPPVPMEASTSSFKPGTPGGFTINNFSTLMSKMTGEERLSISRRSASDTPTSPGISFGRPGQTIRASDRGDPGSDHTGGRGGGERDRSNKVHAVDMFNSQASPLDEGQGIERKVKALLDKLTMDEFDSISDQIVEWANNKSEAEKDGRTFTHIARLTFDKAINDAARSEVYARLCRKITETVSPNNQDDGIQNSDGKPITGGQLFWGYLVNLCQEDFERSLAAKAPEDSAVKKARYAAQKAKQRGLGLIQFIGELYKLQILTERIMHQCIMKLLGNLGNPGEEEIECLFLLLTTVGKLLDSPKARAHMDIYFTRLKELEKGDVAPRIHLMLLVSPMV